MEFSQNLEAERVAVLWVWQRKPCPPCYFILYCHHHHPPPPPPLLTGISTSCLFQTLYYFPIFKIPFKQQENVFKFYTENGKRKQSLLLWFANCFFNSKFTYLSYYWRYWPWQSQFSTQHGAPWFIICSADSLISTGIWWRLEMKGLNTTVDVFAGNRMLWFKNDSNWWWARHFS